MLKKDLTEIKKIIEEVVGNAIKPLEKHIGTVEGKIDSVDSRLGTVEGKIDKVQDDIDDLKLETKALHLIITTQSKNHEERIERLEQRASR